MSKKRPIMSGSSASQTFASLLNEIPDYPDNGFTTVNRSRASASFARERIEELKGFEKGYSDGHVDGFARGLKEGREQGQADSFRQLAEERRKSLEEFVASLNQVKDWFQEALDEWFVECEDKLTDLSMGAVREILQAELHVSRDSALDMVRQALAEVTHSRHARIRLNPFDSAILQNHKGELLAASGSLRDIELVDDTTIQGGCVIETDGGSVDASVETKLELFSNALKEAA